MDPSNPDQEAGKASALEELVFEYLERREVEGEGVLEELCAAHPAQAEMLRARLEPLRGLGWLKPPSDGPPEGDVPEQLGEFRLLERLGAGGMGIVYRAHQASLDREVALKLVRPEQLFFDGARHRFKREVMVVARLNHPGIVPVYSVGEERGLPFFVMECVEGATLAELLKGLQGRDPARLTGADLARTLHTRSPDGNPEEIAPLFQGTWEQTCLRIVREVGEALDHAHRLGVLHRDIKPSNVMVTGEGRVMLLDFGLSSEEGGERMTRPGSAAGSLAYMAPELHAGGNPTRASDVYGLGVTLFELLALKLPVAFQNQGELRTRAMAGEFRDLRACNAQASWEAETVCLKALERDPSQRYPSADGVSRDLTNVLELRPILAKRAGVFRRVRRWVQRRPAASIALALGALIVVGGPLAYAAQQRAAMRRLSVQSELARANLHKAVIAIHSALSEVERLELQDVPHAQVLRRTVLETATRLFDDLELDNLADPELEWRSALSWMLMASLQWEQGEFEVAQRNFNRALDVQARLADQQPDDAYTKLRFAQTWHGQGVALKSIGDKLAARDALSRALEIVDSTPPDGPHHVDLLLLAGKIQRSLGQLAIGERDMGTAELHMRPSVDLLEEAVAFDPQDGRLAPELALSRRMLGDVFVMTDRRVEARALYEDAVRGLEAFLKGRPTSKFYRDGLANALINLSGVLVGDGDFDEGRAAVRRALAVHAALAVEFDHHFQVESNHGGTLRRMGLTYIFEDRPEEALEWYDASVAVLEPLWDADPENPELCHELAMTFQAYSIAITAAGGSSEDALQLIERALELTQSALRQRSSSPAYLETLQQQKRVQAALLAGE